MIWTTAVVDGGERDCSEALAEKVGLLAADLGEFPMLGLGCVGRFGPSVAGQVEQPVRHADPLDVGARSIMLLGSTPEAAFSPWAMGEAGSPAPSTAEMCWLG
jgi:hypothetical protein